jgi:hypothetical protein
MLPCSMSSLLVELLREFANLKGLPKKRVWNHNRIRCLFFVMLLANVTGWSPFLASGVVLISTILMLLVLLVFLVEQSVLLHLFRSPASILRALASCPCTVCHELVLHTQPRADVPYYPRPHTWDLCKHESLSYLCAAFQCQCHCLRAVCYFAKSSECVDFECCQSCKVFAHHICNQMSHCYECERAFCSVCKKTNLRDINAYMQILPACAVCRLRGSLSDDEDPEDYQSAAAFLGRAQMTLS